MFISECYRDGAVMLEFDKELKSKVFIASISLIAGRVAATALMRIPK